MKEIWAKARELYMRWMGVAVGDDGKPLTGQAGIAAAPFVLIITAVLVVVIGIELVATVVEETDAAITLSTSGSNFALSGTILQFVPVVYIAAIMGIAGGIAFIAGRATAVQDDRFISLIMAVLVVVIGISLTTPVLEASQNAIDAITTAVNDMPLAETIMPFLPVVYVAAILGLASMSGLRAIRG